jgi:hypothetical protein
MKRLILLLVTTKVIKKTCKMRQSILQLFYLIRVRSRTRKVPKTKRGNQCSVVSKAPVRIIIRTMIGR